MSSWWFRFSHFRFWYFFCTNSRAIKITTILQKQQEEKTSKLHKCWSKVKCTQWLKELRLSSSPLKLPSLNDMGAWLTSFEIKTKNSFLVPVKRVSKTSSPVDYYPDTREMELKCTFKGWPRPRVVWYNPDKKQIINGSEGFYISEQLFGEDTLRSVLLNPNIQEKQAGAYQCTGMNNITGWSTKKSVIIELYHRCESFNFLFLLIYTDAQNHIN